MLALWLGQDREIPLLVAANRDESYARPSAAPAEIEPGIVAGKDLQAGGTWLGINRHGIFVGITNRHSPARTSDQLSRGQLALEALRCSRLSQVEGAVERTLRIERLAGFNLVAAADGWGVAFHFDGTLRRLSLAPGVHVISSNRDADDQAMPEKQVLGRMLPTGGALPTDGDLAKYLASHEGEPSVCKHGDGYGTVSSTILSLSAGGDRRLLYAPGPPCRSTFAETRLSFSSP